MFKPMTHSAILFFTIMTLLNGHYDYGQTVKHDNSQTIIKTDTLSIYGHYEGVICFRISECCTTKLLLKENYEYKMKLISNNHGRKNKSIEYGTWMLEGEILILNKNKTKDDDKPELEKYKVIKSNLWYYSTETLEPTEIALKRK